MKTINGYKVFCVKGVKAKTIVYKTSNYYTQLHIARKLFAFVTIFEQFI